MVFGKVDRQPCCIDGAPGCRVLFEGAFLSCDGVVQAPAPPRRLGQCLKLLWLGVLGFQEREELLVGSRPFASLPGTHPGGNVRL